MPAAAPTTKAIFQNFTRNTPMSECAPNFSSLRRGRRFQPPFLALAHERFDALKRDMIAGVAPVPDLANHAGLIDQKVGRHQGWVLILLCQITESETADNTRQLEQQ